MALKYGMDAPIVYATTVRADGAERRAFFASAAADAGLGLAIARR